MVVAIHGGGMRYEFVNLEVHIFTENYSVRCIDGNGIVSTEGTVGTWRYSATG